MIFERSSPVLLDCIRIEQTFIVALKKMKDKSITNNIFWVQSKDSIIFEFDCIAFIELTIAEKTLLDYAKLFSSNDC